MKSKPHANEDPRGVCSCSASAFQTNWASRTESGLSLLAPPLSHRHAQVRGQAAQLYQAHQVESIRSEYLIAYSINKRKQCGYGRTARGHKQKLDRWRLQQIHILLPELGNPACKLNYVLPMGDEPSSGINGAAQRIPKCFSTACHS